MTTYDRSASTGCRLIDEFDGGVGWLAYPNEMGQRASHALVTNGTTQLRALFDAL